MTNMVGGWMRRHPAGFVFITSLLGFALFNVLPLFREAGHIAQHGPYHTHVLLADAFLDGRLTFLDKAYKDMAEFEGKLFSPFPPFPAILLTPLVAVFGTSLPITLVTPFLGALVGVALFRFLAAMGMRNDVSLWSTFAFLFGTVFWFTVRTPIDTCLAHILATGLIFSALDAAARQRAAWFIGLAIGAAFLCRQLTVFALPLAWVLLMRPPEGGFAWKNARFIAQTVPGLALALIGYLVYNFIRFGDPFNAGYAYIHEPDWYGSRMEKWGITHWMYIPSNAVRLFLQGFVIEWVDTDRMIPTMSDGGTSLTFASPFVFFALRGAFPRAAGINLAGWTGIAIIMLGVLMNKNGMGGWQINGMRYALDFLPLVMVFAANGMNRLADSPYRALWKAAILYAVTLNLIAIGLTYVPKIITAFH
ncbi:MAG TPA: hypothetical protein PKE26_09520 [Kiritimatiellia bacterium]|nr:hypothetical protein [Kiritimatiellia bacterium]HMP96092.1 hypothetical protein [Kiritimatiellia bacterium]